MAAFNKLLGKSSSLQAILDKQKSLQECMVKSNPCRINGLWIIVIIIIIFGQFT